MAGMTARRAAAVSCATALCALAVLLAGGDAAHAANVGSTAHGEVGVDQFGYAVGQGKNVMVAISGEVYDAGRTKIDITITHPDGYPETHTVRSSRDGAFVHHHILDYHTSQTGTYYVSARADGKVLGQVGFEMRYMGGPPDVRYGDQTGAGREDAGSGTVLPQSDGNQMRPPQPPAGGRGLTVYTDRPHYHPGDTVRIYGTAEMSETVMIRATLGSVYESVGVHPDGTYLLEIETAGRRGLADGTHEVWVGSSGPSGPATTAFTFGAAPAAGADRNSPADPVIGLLSGLMPEAGINPMIMLVAAVVILAVIIIAVITAASRRRKPTGGGPGEENQAYSAGAGGVWTDTVPQESSLPPPPPRPAPSSGAPTDTHGSQTPMQHGQKDRTPVRSYSPSSDMRQAGAEPAYRITGREAIVPDSNMIIDILQYPTGLESDGLKAEIAYVLDNLDRVMVPSGARREIDSRRWERLKPEFDRVFGGRETDAEWDQYMEHMPRLQRHVKGIADSKEEAEKWIKAKRRDLKKYAAQNPQKYADLNSVLHDSDMANHNEVYDSVIPAICDSKARRDQAVEILTDRIGKGDMRIMAQAMAIARSEGGNVILLSNDTDLATILAGALEAGDGVHVIPHWKFNESVGC